MITLYGVAIGTDLQRLREPLLEPLKALAELEPFVAKFKLNTLKLTASGYGQSPYDYFEAFLTTLQGFPIVAISMSTFLRPTPTSSRPHHRQPVPVPDPTDSVPTGTIKRIPILWHSDPKASQQ
jgi:hypothetical protein